MISGKEAEMLYFTGFSGCLNKQVNYDVDTVIILLLKLFPLMQGSQICSRIVRVFFHADSNKQY